MFKKLRCIYLKYKIWFLILIIMDILFGVFLWLTDADSFSAVFGALLLSSFGLYSAVTFAVYRAECRREKAIMDFLHNPEQIREDIAVNSVSCLEREQIRVIGEKLRERDQKIKDQNLNMEEYQEYIETWAHEIKTPLALMTFVLDNRKKEVPPVIYQRLVYAMTQMQEDVERMLYYARLKTSHADYLFTSLQLDECCRDVLEEYEILLKERKICIIDEVENLSVVSDKKGLSFLISQVISNSSKYRKTKEGNPYIKLYTAREEGKAIILIIQDNGIGVRPYDLPFLFDKGFTGDLREQRKASTGMGLYLAKQVAENLKIRIEISEEYEDGFEIKFYFPEINRF